MPKGLLLETQPSGNVRKEEVGADFEPLIKGGVSDQNQAGTHGIFAGDSSATKPMGWRGGGTHTLIGASSKQFLDIQFIYLKNSA